MRTSLTIALLLFSSLAFAQWGEYQQVWVPEGKKIILIDKRVEISNVVVVRNIQARPATSEPEVEPECTPSDELTLGPGTVVCDE
jgi:hypothetical protein